MFPFIIVDTRLPPKVYLLQLIPLNSFIIVSELKAIKLLCRLDRRNGVGHIKYDCFVMHNRGDWQFLSPCQGRYEKEQSIAYARRIVAYIHTYINNLFKDAILIVRLMFFLRSVKEREFTKMRT